MQAPANPDLEIWCKIFRRLIYVDLGNCKCAEPGGGGYIEDSPSPTNSSGPATQQVSRANIYSAAREPGGRPAGPEGRMSQKKSQYCHTLRRGSEPIREESKSAQSQDKPC